jgi:Family of unknown function (DUF5670)
LDTRKTRLVIADSIRTDSQFELRRTPKRRFGVDADAYSASNQPRHPNAEGATSLKEMYMLWTIFVVLLLLWILGFSFHIAGSLIHLVLVIAVVVLIIQLITGRRAL